MTERDFQTYFSKWVKHNFPFTFAYELKICKGTSINFDAVAPHQSQNLLNAKHRFLAYKIPDDSRGQKPFDGFKLNQVPSYVVVFFYGGKGNGEFTIIDIDAWEKERIESSRKSLTLIRAREIGTSFVKSKVGGKTDN